MKKLLLIPIITMLFACSSNTTLSVNEPLTYDVKIKDNAEFILVKEGTSVDEFANNLEGYLDIDTNADSYTIECAGEKYSSLTAEEYLDKKGTYPFKTSLEETLSHDSFRPIGLYITFEKDGKSETDYKQIILAVAREEEYNVISSSDAKTIENAYRNMCNDSSTDYDLSFYDNLHIDNYLTNIRQH